MSPALEALCAALGVSLRYHDGTGILRAPPPESLAAACAALGYPAASRAEAAESLARLSAARAARALPAWHVCQPGVVPGLAPPAPWALQTEAGGSQEGGAQTPLPPLPPGLHRLDCAGESCTLICAPPALPLPPRGWGLMAPLYGLWEGAPRGLGSYAHLAALARGAAAAGADFLGINPVHAGFPEDHAAFSPYAPSHRRRLDILSVAPGGPEPGPAGPLISHAEAIPARMAALRRAFDAAEQAGARGLEALLAEGGEALARFCIHQALSERFGPYWHRWPEPFRRPDSPEVAAFARDHRRALRFHGWAQWQAQRQLAAAGEAAREAGMAHGLYLDLAVGTHPYGAETWGALGGGWGGAQGSGSGDGGDPAPLFPAGISLGAPPDALAPQGQDWQLAPFSPLGLVARGLAPFAETLRAQLAHAGVLRIDHILGFERSFWIPEGLPGLYVAMPREALLAVTRLEAARARGGRGAVVVGEDLGAVPDGLRAALAGSGILGCCVAWLERDWERGNEAGAAHRFHPPEEWSEAALASLSTHDLPTWAGWHAGREIDWRERLGLVDPVASARARIARPREAEAFARAIAAPVPPPGATPGQTAWLEALGRARSRLVAVQAEDVLESLEQANLPGTIHEHPNWRRRLAAPVSALAGDPRLERAGRIMAGHGRGTPRR